MNPMQLFSAFWQGNSWIGSGVIITTNTTQSTSTATGSIITAGGVGIAKNLYVGGLLNVAGSVTGGAASFTTLATSGRFTFNGDIILMAASSALQMTGTGGASGVWALDDGADAPGTAGNILTAHYYTGASWASARFKVDLATGNTTALGNLTVGASTFVVTAATGKATAGFLVVNAANDSHAANRGLLSFEGSNRTFLKVYGTDASTKGAFVIQGVTSDGSASLEYLAFTTAGVATFGSSLAITGALTGVTAANINTTGAGTGELRIANATQFSETGGSTVGLVRVESTYAGVGSNIVVFFASNAAADSQINIFNSAQFVTGIQARRYSTGVVQTLALNPSGGAVTMGASLAITGALTGVTNEVFSGYLEGTEMVAPAAPAANKGRIFFQDNGAGKTQLMVIFPTGAAQQIAIEP